MPEIELTEPQSDFYHSTSTYTAAVAGFGSGKTQVAATRILSNIFKYPTIDQAYLAPTYALIRDIFYPFMSELLSGMNIGFRINKGEHNIYVQGHGKIICRTMNNPDMIVGWQAGDAFLDEFDILTEEKATAVMRKLSARLRQIYPNGKKNQRWVTTTPEGFKATYKMFKKEPLKDSRLIQMSTYSNPHLPPEYIPDLIDLYPEQLIKAYLNGEFVNLTSGTVYYSFDRFLHNTRYVARPREPLHIGMDFNVYHMAAIVHIIRGGVPYAVDEFVGYRDTPDIVEAIRERYPDNTIYVYPDATGKGTSSKSATVSDLTILRDPVNKFIVKAKNKNPLIKDRVTSMVTAFEKDRYFVNVEKCPIYTESLEQQVYDDLGRPDKDSGQDHQVDASGYFIFYRWPVLKTQLQQHIVSGVINNA